MVEMNSQGGENFHPAVMEIAGEVEAYNRRGRSCELSREEISYLRKVVPMCLFGDKLQETCAANLTADIAGSGSDNSECIRRQERKGVSMIQSMLEERTNGADFEKATLANCIPLSDDRRDVGDVDVQTYTAYDLNSGNFFKLCRHNVSVRCCRPINHQV